MLMVGLRDVFDPDYVILPGDAELLSFRRCLGEADKSQPGTVFLLQMIGAMLIVTSMHKLCCTFGGGGKNSFQILAVGDAFLAAVFGSSVYRGFISFRAVGVFIIPLLIEIPCLWVLGNTNGVAEPDGPDHDD